MCVKVPTSVTTCLQRAVVASLGVQTARHTLDAYVRQLTSPPDACSSPDAYVQRLSFPARERFTRSAYVDVVIGLCWSLSYWVIGSVGVCYKYMYASLKWVKRNRRYEYLDADELH